ncbi:MAG TPA: DUF4292 domain-containing protein [Bacteroidales bacterium]|nr:DUF4292 domain-containing protein [Bacteroidales bacterium]
MYKIISIFVVCFLLIGCSIGRKGLPRNKQEKYAPDLLETNKIGNSNITHRDFFIQRALIDLENDGSKISLLANIKHKRTGEYLISIRFGSIEAGRMYFNADTLLINDRINKVVYYGKPDFIYKRLGFSPGLFPLIFGDFVKGETDNAILNCKEHSAEYVTSVKGLNIKYIIDCLNGKAKEVIQQGSLNNINSQIRYDRFFEAGNIFIPGEIYLRNIEPVFNMKLRIEKIESPWSGNIEFVPGKGYELKELK